MGLAWFGRCWLISARSFSWTSGSVAKTYRSQTSATAIVCKENVTIRGVFGKCFSVNGAPFSHRKMFLVRFLLTSCPANMSVITWSCNSVSLKPWPVRGSVATIIVPRTSSHSFSLSATTKSPIAPLFLFVKKWWLFHIGYSCKICAMYLFSWIIWRLLFKNKKNCSNVWRIKEENGIFWQIFQRHLCQHSEASVWCSQVHWDIIIWAEKRLCKNANTLLVSCLGPIARAGPFFHFCLQREEWRMDI